MNVCSTRCKSRHYWSPQAKSAPSPTNKGKAFSLGICRGPHFGFLWAGPLQDAARTEELVLIGASDGLCKGWCRMTLVCGFGGSEVSFDSRGLVFGTCFASVMAHGMAEAKVQIQSIIQLKAAEMP